MRSDLCVGRVVNDGMPRFLEVLFASIGLVFSGPLIGLSALAIALTSPGPIIFRQERIGFRGRRFLLYKLRTMTVDRQSETQFTAADDSRVSAVGRLLRKTKVDELPELWNVVKGDMSLVGPRPEVPRYVDLENPVWRFVLEARPGITDPVTLSLRNEEALLAAVNGNREDFYKNTLQPFKLSGYRQYLQHRTAWQDVKVLWQTCRVVVSPNRAPLSLLKETPSPIGKRV